MNYQVDSQFCAVEVTQENTDRCNIQNVNIAHGILGISGEISEINEAYELVNFKESDIDTVNLKEELGDICWYIANLATAINYVPVWKKETESKYKDPFLVLPEDVDKFQFFINNSKISGISGKLVDLLKRVIFYGVSFDEQLIKTSLNKLIIILHKMADNLCVTLEECQTMNIDKLTERYGEKFTEEAAVNRNLNSEREVLEK